MNQNRASSSPDDAVWITHSVRRSLNKPLTIWGVDRRLFFLALITGAATFNFFATLLGGVLMFVVLFLLARYATTRDPDLLKVVLKAAAMSRVYDPIKVGSQGDQP